jgi:acyl-CoA thioester hydrolase
MYKSPPYRVYIHDTDVAGVVHHSNYLRYFEAGRIEFLRNLGIPYTSFQAKGIGFVPIHIDINYRKPLRQDDLFHVTVALVSVKRASFTLKQSVINASGPLHVEGTVQLACVQEPEFRPMRLPDIIRQQLHG